MPVYDFHCLNCDGEIQVIASIQALEEGRIRCSNCGASNLRRSWKKAPYVGRLAPSMDLGAMNRKDDPESCCVWDPSAE